jgi:hypothetical protein
MIHYTNVMLGIEYSLRYLIRRFCIWLYSGNVPYIKYIWDNEHYATSYSCGNITYLQHKRCLILYLMEVTNQPQQAYVQFVLEIVTVSVSDNGCVFWEGKHFP